MQFHPEVTHTLQGKRLLERFVREISGCEALWSVGKIIEDAVARVRAQVGKGKMPLGLSGGVDSSVVAALLHKAIGAEFVKVFDVALTSCIRESWKSLFAPRKYR